MNIKYIEKSVLFRTTSMDIFYDLENDFQIIYNKILSDL